MIETTVDKQHDLTLHKCSGTVTEEELTNTIYSLYDGTPTLNIIWDCSDASVDGISSSFIRRIAKVLGEIGSSRKGGKSAVIAPDNLIFGLARMFQIMSDTDDFPFKINVFRHFREACKWLFEKDE